MKIVHITSIDAALSIIRSRTFVPASTDPLNGDAGLNGLELSQSHECNDWWFTGTGARLLFEWDGPVDTSTTVPLSPNVLHDDMPYRVVVPAGTTRHLALTGFEPDPDLWTAYPLLPWYCLTPASQNRARHRALVRLQRQIDAIVAARPAIRVGLAVRP